MKEEDDHRPAPRDDAVWQAVDQFSEALRDLQEEVRALAQIFERPHERTRTSDEPPGRATSWND